MSHVRDQKKVYDNFIKDVSKHVMKIHVDTAEPLNRIISFGKPGCSYDSFQIVTWPQYLVFTGDRGTFVFSRVKDMFTFFRDRSVWDCSINAGYWSEKLQSGIGRTYCPDIAKEKVTESLKDYYIENILPFEEETNASQVEPFNLNPVLTDFFNEDENKKENYEKLSEEVSNLDFEDESILRMELSRIEDEYDNALFGGSLFEIDFREFTYEYIWCCFAIVWAIRQYDAAKEAEQAKLGKEQK